MRLAVIGTGYVGLVSAVCLASKGHTVGCFDIDEAKISQLSEGECSIYERGLPELLEAARDNLLFVELNRHTESKLLEYDLIMIAVGTPSTNGRSDLSQIERVACMIGGLLRESNKFISVVIKSTVVPGTTGNFVRNIIERESGKKLGQFGLGMNPEFLREGDAVEDFLNPDRIIFGHEDPVTLSLLQEAYGAWGSEKLAVNTITAEMTKYVNNALLATLISTTNEYSNVARKLSNVDFELVMRGVHLDKRWSPISEEGERVYPGILEYLKPGSGYGGSCFPKDVMAIKTLAADLRVPNRILSAVIDVNDSQPAVIVDLLQSKIPDLNVKEVLLLGLAFKPGTDDVRESVALKLATLLECRVKKLRVHDPIATNNAREALGAKARLEFIGEWRPSLATANVIIIAAGWPEYLDLASMGDDLMGKVILDTKGIFSAKDFLGASYISVN